VAERQLPKLNVAGSIPVSRSNSTQFWIHSAGTMPEDADVKQNIRHDTELISKSAIKALGETQG
jgi:hypothetical protein